MRFGSVLAAAAVLSTSLAAHADTVYTYTGPDYTYASGAYNTSESISGTLTLAEPLGQNLDFESVPYVTFDFSDGVYTYTPADTDPTQSGFLFSTNAAGAITAFEVDLTIPGIYPAGQPTVLGVRTVGVEDYSVGGPGGYAYSSNVGSFDAGVTTPAATPEPSSFALLASGLLGVGGVVRRRFVSAQV